MKKAEYFEAQRLRQAGMSLTEICGVLHVSKSTISGWVKNIELTKEAQTRLRQKVTAGQLKSAENKRARSKVELREYYDVAAQSLSGFELDRFHSKLFCSMLYRCEGGKGGGGIRFTNSDPVVIKSFLRLFRSSYPVKEAKFRVCIHLHSYHDIQNQIVFWSRVTGISEKQFIKPFMKMNQGKNIHAEYEGCAQIRYHDAKVAKDLTMTGQALIDFTNRSLV